MLDQPGLRLARWEELYGLNRSGLPGTGQLGPRRAPWQAMAVAMASTLNATDVSLLPEEELRRLGLKVLILLWGDVLRDLGESLGPSLGRLALACVRSLTTGRSPTPPGELPTRARTMVDFGQQLGHHIAGLIAAYTDPGHQTTQLRGALAGALEAHDASLRLGRDRSRALLLSGWSRTLSQSSLVAAMGRVDLLAQGISSETAQEHWVGLALETGQRLVSLLQEIVALRVPQPPPWPRPTGRAGRLRTWGSVVERRSPTPGEDLRAEQLRLEAELWARWEEAVEALSSLVPGLPEFDLASYHRNLVQLRRVYLSGI